MTPFWICAAIYVALAIGWVLGIIMATPPATPPPADEIFRDPDESLGERISASRWIQ